MAIPALVDGRLPPGPHPCTWEELEERFGAGHRRQELIIELRAFVQTAEECGFAGLAIGGSFPTDKPEPGDLDLLFITPENLDKGSLSIECAQLLVDNTRFRERTGHDALNCPDDQETIAALVSGLGYDWKSGKDRGMLLVRL